MWTQTARVSTPQIIYSTCEPVNICEAALQLFLIFSLPFLIQYCGKVESLHRSHRKTDLEKVRSRTHLSLNRDKSSGVDLNLLTFWYCIQLHTAAQL